MNRVLLAGATGHLGQYILTELLDRGIETRAIVRRLATEREDNKNLEILKAEVTDPQSLVGSCRDIDVVISTVGITRQKEGLTYMDVDFQANLNLLEEARRSGVKKFVYVSVFNGDKMRRLRICDAKERFIEVLKGSGLEYCVIRPNGYFSDIGEFFKMAQKGRVYLFGNGQHRINPIHGGDLAQVCVDAIAAPQREIAVGGPQTFTYEQIAKLAFFIAGNKEKITHIPDGLRKAVLFLLRTFTSSKTYGPIEFFLTVLSTDLVAPEYGSHTLEEYFRTIKFSDLRGL